MCLPVLRFQVSTREFINMGIVRWIGVFCFLFVFSFSFSQSINDIKKKKERTEKEIAYLNKLLKEADKDKSATVEKLTIINQKISKGKEMLQSLRNEAAYLQKLIADNTKIKTRLEHDKQQMLDLYSKMVYETWKKRGKYNHLIYIFSSSSLSQAYARYKYFEQIGDYSKTQIRKIESTNDSLTAVIKDLKVLVNQKNATQSKIAAQNNELLKEQNEANSYISELKKKEKDLSKKLKNEINNREHFNAELKKLIAAQTKKSGSKNSTYKQTPQEQLLSADFEKNKGKLPWPVEQGFISEKFGVNIHPVFKQVKLSNDGITITTSKNAAVRSVFGGVISEIMFIPGYNNVVIIRHGNYLTVYSNLVEVSVKKGDTVKVKQVIGKLAESAKGNSTLNFQVWKDKVKLNPQVWLVPM